MNPRCVEQEMNQSTMTQPMAQPMPHSMENNGCMCPPVYECPTERVCQRVIVHEVPHEIHKSETFI